MHHADHTVVQTSDAGWSAPMSTDELVEKAPFTVIPAIVNSVEGCNKS